MKRPAVRLATTKDLDLLVRHRRAMWEAISDFSPRDLDAADSAYRSWARARMGSGRLAGFIVDLGGRPVASGCAWLVPIPPRPSRAGTTAAYLLSMFTEPDQRGKGHARRIVRAAIRWSRDRGMRVVLLHASDFGEPVYRGMGFERTREMRLVLVRSSGRRNRRRPKSNASAR